MKMRCDGCKYWDQDEGANWAGVGECTKAKPLWKCSEWKEVDDDYKRVMLPGCEPMKMFVHDGSDYAAHLLTKPDFFCAEFEAGAPSSP